jgi:hypothetical protein
MITQTFRYKLKIQVDHFQVKIIKNIFLSKKKQIIEVLLPVTLAIDALVGFSVDFGVAVLESMGARVGMLIDFNDGVVVVGAEVGSPSFAVGLRVDITEERIKRRQ